MGKDKLEKAQVGTSIPKPTNPKAMLDEGFMEQRYGGYRQSTGLPSPNAGSVVARSYGGPGEGQPDVLSTFLKELADTPSSKGRGPKMRTADQYIGSDRYDYFSADPGWDNEDAAAQNQGWGSKMVNGVGKGLALTGTTFLQNTVGLVNGVIQAASDGRFASFYDNDFNNALDEFNKELEDSLPNYYTAAERDAEWYSPTYWAKGNFLWDGVVKNMGFAAGTYLSAGAYTAALKGLPLASKLFSTGKAAETIAATEAGLAGGKGAAGIYGELKSLSDTFLKTANGYNTLNKGQRVLVAGLSTTGEAGFEALHNANEFREGLVSQYKSEFGIVPTGEALDDINRATDAAANRSMVANMVLLTATNYIQLPKIFQSSYNSEKTLLNGLGREIGDVSLDAAGVMSKTKVTKLGRVVNAIRKPYLFSYSEALEESSQYGIGEATKDYYQKAYNGEATNWMSSIKAGLDSMVSDEGAKNALIGGLSGSIMMNIAPSVRSLLGGPKTQKQRIRQNTDDFVTAFNKTNLGDAVNAMQFDLSNFTKETGEAVNRGTVIQQERERALKNGEIFESKNLESDYIINYLTPRIKYGRFDLIQSEIEEYRTLAGTDAGFDQLVKEGKALTTDTRESYLARISRFSEVADSAQSLYQSLNLRFGAKFKTNDLGDVIEDEKGNPILEYPPSVMNQMMYTALKTEDFDQRILNLGGKLSAAGINTQAVLQSVVDGDFKAYNEAVVQLKESDMIGSKKDQLGSYLDDIADAASQRQNFIKTYDDIKENPSKYTSEPVIVKDQVEEEVETIKVQTEKGIKDVAVETEYFVGNSVDYNEDGLDELFKIGTLIVKGYNEDGTLKIVNTKTGEERDLKRGTFNKLKLGKVSSVKNNSAANWFYNHRNEIFRLNRGKLYGGYVDGRIEYEAVNNDTGKIYFVYKTNGGKIKRKQIDNSFLVPQKGFNQPRLQSVGSVQSKNQKDSFKKYTSAAEIQKQRKKLKENREARLEVLTQLGEESKENIVELNKQIEKAASDLVKVKEDLANIRKMKKTGETGPRIKLNFSKATKSFTRTINKLTQMRKDLNKTIKLAEIERDELAADVSYFEQYTNEISDAPEDSGEFLQELKDQVKLLADNGKNLAKIIKAAKKMGTTLRQVTKKAASLFRKAIKSTYIVGDDYAQALDKLLDDVAAGENLDVTWPALKEEIVNFKLTNDISKDVNLNESDIVKTQDEVAKLTTDINELRNEYRARKIILDRFQSIMNEYNAKKAAQEKLANDQRLIDRIFATGIKAPALNEYEGAYNPDSKKSTEILPVATIPNDDESEDYQIRSNTFGANLNSFENRDEIRGVYLTSAIEDQLLPGVIDKMLSGGKTPLSEEQKEKFKETMIVMVMVNEDGDLVNVNGQPIAEDEDNLDNAIYQAMPEAGLTNTKGSMFRENTPDEVVNSIKEQYKEFRESVLAQDALGIPQIIEASFGTPEYEKNDAGDRIYTTVTSVQDAGLVTEDELESEVLIKIPTSKGSLSEGTTSYNSPIGRAFLRLKNAYVPLKNRKHTEEEATVIYQSILELSKNIEKGQGLESDASIDILNFLKRVTYWGIPIDNAGERKEPGRNSVFFERTVPEAGGVLQFAKLQLTIGRSPDAKFDFSPTELEMSKDVIITLLQNTYNNINAYDKILDNIDAEFQQITGIENGEVQSVTWDNYQTYLLSNTNPDGSKRPNSDLPLHTMMKPKVEGEVNRNNIYFFSKTGQDNYTIPNPSSQAPKELIIKDGKIKAPVADTPVADTGGYVLDGETTDVYTSPEGATLNFRFDKKATEPSWDQVAVLQGGDLKAIVKKITGSEQAPKDVTEEELKSFIGQQLKKTIFKSIEKVLPKRKAKVAFESSIVVGDSEVEAGQALGSLFDDAPAPAPVPKAPVKPTQQTINIYAGTNENAELSNFANRPFSYKGREYKNVEQAFQHQKLMTFAPNTGAANYLNDEVGSKILQAKTGAEAKKLGRQIKQLNTVAWDRSSSSIMKDLITESFKQNPQALAKLLATGNATLTHTQDKTKYRELFPKILMEVRQELSGSQQDSTSQTREVIPKEKIPQYKMADVFEFVKQLPVEKFGTSKLRSRLEDLVDKPYLIGSNDLIDVLEQYSIPVDKNINETLSVLKEADDEFKKLNMRTPQNKKEADRWVELLGYKNSFVKYVADAIATKYKVKPLKIGIANNDLLVPTQQTIEVVITDDTPSGGGLNFQDDIDDAIADMNDEHFREVIEGELELAKTENWSEVKSWMSKNLPQVPLNIVKNIIEAGGGRTAWGMYKDRAIYVYENAEVGTTYHEAFEAVFNGMLSTEDKTTLRKEFNSRKGTFVDRPTGETVKFSEATGQQIKEQLAEEFRDYIQEDIKPKGLFARMFKKLKDLIEKWFMSPSSDTFTKELFDKINTGGFVNTAMLDFSYQMVYSPSQFDSNFAFAVNFQDEINSPIDYRDPFVTEPEYRLVTLDDQQMYDTLQEMTYQLVVDTLKNDADLFNLTLLKGNEAETYNKILRNVLRVAQQKGNVATKYMNLSKSAKAKGEKQFQWGTKTRDVLTAEEMSRLNISIFQNKKLKKNIVETWPLLIDKHKQYLQSFNVSFDQSAQEQLEDNDRIRESNKFDASKIDSLKAASSTLKLLLATLQIKNSNGKPEISTINGSVLQPIGKTYVTLMTKLHDSPTVDDAMLKLKELGQEYPTYASLYTRITGDSIDTKGVSFDSLSLEQSRLITAMWRTFHKMTPEALNTYVYRDGVTVGPAAYSSAADQLTRNYINDISTLSKSDKGLFNYNKVTGKYTPKKAVINNAPLNTPMAMSNFLKKLGVSFSEVEIRKLYRIGKQEKIKDVVSKVRDSLASIESVTTFSKDSLDINRRLKELAFLQTLASNPEYDSTYYNVNGERVQTAFGGNVANDLYVTLKNVKKKEDLAGTPFEYLLTDVFSQGSSIMSRMFTSKGVKKPGAENLFSPGIAGGIVYDGKKSNKGSSRLTARERYIQELNFNLAGTFMNLVPGDASLEHTLYMGNPVDESQLSKTGLARVISNIFKPYLLSEINLSRDDRPIPEVEYEKGTPEFEKRKTTDLRFFKDILGEDLHNKIVNETGSPEDIYKIYINDINKAIATYIQRWVSRNQTMMTRYGMIQVSGSLVATYTIPEVALKENMKADQFNRSLTALGINYMIANIEMHKLLYSDPYQYTDELKRTKSFLSPRQTLVNNSPMFQAQQNKLWNKGYESSNDIGYYSFTKDHFVTATHSDVVGAIDLPGYKPYEETDGASIISFPAYRAMRIQSDNWNAAEEKQYRYDIAWEKRDKSIKRSPEELALLKEGNPAVKSAYPDQKPIVSGSKLDKSGNNSSYNNVVLDKNSLYPLSYRIMKEVGADNGVKLYDKMQKEGIDYIAFKSARKVGAESLHSTYNKDGSFNNDEYKDKILIPFSIMGIQSEVPSKEVSLVTRGSQTTKLLTLDMFDNGVPIDFKQLIGEEELSREKQWENLSLIEKKDESPIYREAIINTEILEALTEDAYQRVLRRLGISETNEGYEIINMSEAAKTLRSELFKREVNDNISIALEQFETKGVALEITPAYQQVRNILYSIINKELVRSKISGGQKTQIPSTLFEKTRAEFNEKLNGHTSDILKFYEDKDGKRVMEIGVGRWFNSNMSDEKLLEYLNKKENQGILEGLAFRIPTQAQNSIDVIRVGMILPKEFGDNVVVPSAIVEKVGSDFDIDKLSIYLKNVIYINNELKEVPFFGTGTNSKRKIADLFDSGKLFNAAQKKQLDALGQLKSWEVQGLINNDAAIENNPNDKYGDLLAQLGVVDQEDSLETFINELSEIGVRDAVVNKLYKQSLENGYINSSRKLASHSQNFEKLIRPNSADYLKDLAKRVVNKTKGQAFNYTKVGNMLDNRFMLSLRQAFVSGKKAIGIDAISQTGLSLNQKSIITIDTDRLTSLPKEDQAWLGDGKIAFKNYNKYEGKASLSGIYNAAGQLISNINSQLMDGHVDISKGPWIMELGATPQLAPTILFLNGIGVPIDQIIFFVNQPIIRTYLNTLENEGKTWLFNPDIYNETIDQYGGFVRTETKSKDFVIPNADTLEQTMSSSSKIDSNQPQYLKEFLKYARMSGEYYKFTNGTNFDTTVINDHFLIFKKQIQYKQAQESLIAGAESRLNDTWLGNLANRLGITEDYSPGGRGNTRDAISSFLLSDRGNVRRVLETILLPHINKSDKQFIKIARKAVNSLIDWGVQTRGLNTQLQKVLLDTTGTSAQALELVNKIKTAKKGSPYYTMRNNLVVNNLQAMPARSAGNLPNNLKLNSIGTKAYDVNSVIFSFRSLKKFLQTMGQANLYDDIVKLSVLQSGLANSPISFTSYLPYEDVASLYKYTLRILDNMPNLQNFADVNMLERNSWTDSDIVSSDSLYMITPQNSNARQASYPAIASWARPASVNNAFNDGKIPLTITQDVRYFKPGDDIISYNWNDLSVSRIERNQKRKEGDYSYINKGLFKRVMDQGDPLVYYNPKTKKNYFIYKAINGLGDGFRAQEYYDTASKSKIDNQLIKVTEVSDATVVSAWSGALDLKYPSTEEGGAIMAKLNDGRILLADGEKYIPEEITAKLLEEIGYSKKSANIILTLKCKG